MRYLAPLALLLLLAAPAAAVPPPPPMPETLSAAQTFITALTSKDFTAYDSVLADDFTGHKAGKAAPLGRAAWLAEMRDAFANPGFHATIVHVYEGGATVEGRFRQQVMLVERASNFPLRDGVPGDCCAWYLTETLTIEGGKVTRIDRSVLYSNELSVTGRRTDIP